MVLPGGNGTINLIVLVGQACPQDGRDNEAAVANAVFSASLRCANCFVLSKLTHVSFFYDAMCDD